jgi:phage/plasmid-like protein (TIGR03299 family)
MPANINFNSIKNTYSFASAKEVPWHGLGQIVESAMTSKEAIELANLDFQVGKLPIWGKYPNDITIKLQKKGVEIPNYFATYRQDTGLPFGIVKGRYEVVQNTEAFEFFDSIVHEGAAIYETAGALGNGETIFITAKLPYHMRIGKDDLIDNYILLTMSHDGTAAIEAMVTHVRVVCANTLAAAMMSGKHKIKIKHTASAHESLKKAQELMGITSSLINKNEELFNALVNLKIEEKYAHQYFYAMMLNDGQLEQLATQDWKLDYVDTEIISTKTKNIINSIKEYNIAGVGQDMITTKGTVFGAYNAIAGYIQNVKDYKNEEVKMNNVLFGNEYNFNTEALRLAVNMFGSPELQTAIKN